MAFTQMELIQSLGEAMSWFEREVKWGVPPTELRHLCGRIGELYAAVITNGQMANQVNQKGYDVVGANGDQISVKTTAIMGYGGHVTFNSNTLNAVHRVIVLRIKAEEREFEILLDAPIAEARELMSPDNQGKLSLPLSKLRDKTRVRKDIKAIKSVLYQGKIIRELENGSIEVEQNGELVIPVKPILRELAIQLNVGLLNGSDNPFNTRQLGNQIIKSLEALEANSTSSYSAQ